MSVQSELINILIEDKTILENYMMFFDLNTNKGYHMKKWTGDLSLQ